MSTKVSQTKENYLKALYFLDQKGPDISISDLAKRLEVSKPTVNDMVKKLDKKGWIRYEKYKPLQLTKIGRKTAALILRKHRLTEMFLSSIMHFGWEEVHDIAEEIEHINSQKFFDRMDELLGFPTIDPHGSPIPDKKGRLIKPEYKKLSEVNVDDVVKLCALENSSSDFLKFLNRKDIRLGTKIKVIEKEPFDQSMTVNYANKKNITFSEEVCNNLLVV